MKVEFTQTLPTWVEPESPSALDDHSIRAIIRELNEIDREGNHQIGETVTVRVPVRYDTSEDCGIVDKVIHFTKTGPHEYQRHD